MLVSEALKYGMEELKKHAVTDFKSDTSLLLEHSTGLDFRKYFLNRDKSLSFEEEALFRQCLRRRITGEPVQYITNKAYLMGHEFYVDRNVLIPRYDTEILVDTVLRHTKPEMKLLDLCTGSGCILISVMKECPDLLGVGSDISAGALEIAQRNANAHKVSPKLVESDLFERINGMYDVIVSNPPYIDKKDMEELQREVREYEPHLALYGGEDGMDYYRRIIGESKDYLVDGGKIFFEIGYNQLEGVSALLKSRGFVDIFVVKDLNQKDRVIYARKGKKWA